MRRGQTVLAPKPNMENLGLGAKTIMRRDKGGRSPPL